MQRKDVIRERICIDCGTTFEGGPAAKRCPDCRMIAKRAADARCRRDRRAGAGRALGSVDHCQRCGAEYVVSSSKQKYCSEACSRAASLEWQRKHKKETRDPEKVAKLRAASRAKRQKICKYCHMPFWSEKPSELCSDYCREKQKRIDQCLSDINRGRKRNLQKYLDERTEYRKAKASGTDFHTAGGIEKN